MDEHDKIENELDRLGLDPKYRGRYWHIHCPFHEDSNKSAVCFNDGWICCFAGCPRRHINSLVGAEVCSRYSQQAETETKQSAKQDWTDLWLSLDTLESDVKGVPASVLNKLGWRWFPGGFGVPAGIFIPYFNEDRSKVEFFQVRHDDPDRRFTFAPGCTPTVYGKECIRFAKRYLCFTEGSRDSVILRMCGVPAIALPSASSGHLLRNLGRLLLERGTVLVAVCDRDEAGQKLLDNLDVPFVDMRTPVGKDVGDFYAEKGLAEVAKYYSKFKVKKEAHE